MPQSWLIAGPPGCGKTNWILKGLKKHEGSCGFIQLNGYSEKLLEQPTSTDIDYVFLKDHIPHLIDISKSPKNSFSNQDDSLIYIELSQFQLPTQTGLAGIDPRVLNQLERLKLQPDGYLHFGRDAELPIEDTLDFTKIESLTLNLYQTVWDPPSLNTFWFELVNGAYGDVYRAKALLNIPDGRSMFFNWIVSQPGSQFLSLNDVAPKKGRPQRTSHLVIQGKNLEFTRIKSTIHLCLINDSVLEMHQASLLNHQLASTY